MVSLHWNFQNFKEWKAKKWSELRQVCRCRASRLSHCWCLEIKSAEDSWPVMIFFLFFPPLDPSSMLLLYILSRRAESHGLAFMRMWHYQNAHMTVHQLWLLTKWHRKTFRISSLSDMTFLQDSTSFQDMPDPPALSPLSFFSHLSPWTFGCFASTVIIYCSLTGPWILIQSETHIVIKSIKFPSL